MDLWTNLDGASFEALSKTCSEMGVCLEALADVVRVAASAFSPAWSMISDSMRAIQESFTQLSGKPDISLMEALLEDCWECVPPRVRHLALHHPKTRVRNKNWSRIWKIRKEYMQCKR